MQPVQNRSFYKPYIDGLRAIAVLLVIFYHLGLHGFRSGFVGVDIFFVISGFLISSNIIRSLSGQCFSLKDFYLRRIRRIVPVLLAVLVMVTAVAYIVLLPNDLLKYLYSALSTLLYSANVFFYHFYPAGYFAPKTDDLPLLHTWSLGVEEQFYIVWPLLLIGVMKLPARIGKAVVLLLLIGSFVLYVEIGNKHFVFYMPFTRAWEFLFGVALCFWGRGVLLSKKYRLLLSFVGLLLLVPAVLISPSSYYSGWASLVPCVSAVLLIFSGISTPCDQDLDLLLRFFLTNRIAVSVGVISYSAYLIHWPIIAFSHYLGFKMSHGLDLIILALTFAFAYLLHKTVERPFRYVYKFKFLKTFLMFSIVPTFLMGGLAFAARKLEVYGYNDIMPKAYREANQYYGKLKRSSGCIDNKAGPGVLPSKHLCQIGVRKQVDDAVLVGDSHAMADVGMLDVMLSKAGLSAYVVTQSGSPFVLGAGIKSWRDNDPVLRSHKIRELIKKEKYKYVIFAGFWNYYSSMPSSSAKIGNRKFSVFEKGFENAVRFVVSQGSVPVIVYDTPATFSISKYSGSSKLSRLLSKINVVQTNLYSQYFHSQFMVNHFISRLKHQFPSVITINPNKIICNKMNCRIYINSIPLYMSDGANSHLSYDGSVLIGKRYVEKYGSPFL